MKEYLAFLNKMTQVIHSEWRRILALAAFDYKLRSKGMVLGQAWKLLNPLIQIGVYWLVFGIGLRNGEDMDGAPFVVWLTCGLIPWLAMNRSILQASNSIYSKSAVLTRSNVPTYLVPVSAVVSELMDILWSVGILVVVYLGNGCVPTWSAFGLAYYMVCILAFSSACGLIFSVLVMVARDFYQIIQALIRMVYFLSPVFWNPGDSMPVAFQVFDACNPFAYVIRGCRNCLLYGIYFTEDLRGMAIFWCLVGLLYMAGAACQRRLRKNLLDFL